MLNYIICSILFTHSIGRQARIISYTYNAVPENPVNGNSWSVENKWKVRMK